MAGIPVDSAAFAAFDMQELTAETFDVGLQSAGEDLAVVFFWGLDCYNCEIAKKAMLAQPDAIRALGLRWFHSNVYEHRDLGRRFMLHGVPTWFFFHRGKRLGRATGWHGLTQFEAAVAAAREKIRAAGVGTAGLGASGVGTARQGASGAGAAAGSGASGPGAAGETGKPASDNGRTD
ncbi:Thiol-disulfide isomerase and thioredoxin (modular protein) [Paraburkholderia piptadeniae]|uniref:Thiol-disulfide isomerase and thioredoxin (Modular protein) n=1 Tax=Paraburkholderia piptadeniae TaxID=1701573 RepID=A0A1N7RLS8_9BURK|nr:Thiol-disulfide isomerase and thioredoxin (modular protein) [Paraburkholderia piptadeniae]